MTKEKQALLKAFLLANFKDEDGIDISGVDWSDFDGNINIGGWRVKKDLYQSGQQVGNYLFQRCQIVKRDLYQDSQAVGRDLYQNHQEVQGSLYQGKQTAKMIIN